MPISESDKQDIIFTVQIELERMFTVLSHRFPSSLLAEQSLLLDELETAFKNTLKTFAPEIPRNPTGRLTKNLASDDDSE